MASPIIKPVATNLTPHNAFQSSGEPQCYPSSEEGHLMIETRVEVQGVQRFDVWE